MGILIHSWIFHVSSPQQPLATAGRETFNECDWDRLQGPLATTKWYSRAGEETGKPRFIRGLHLSYDADSELLSSCKKRGKSQ